MEDNVITWKPCFKVGGLVVYVTRYGDVLTIDSRGKLVYKKSLTRGTSPACARSRKTIQNYQLIDIHHPHTIHLYAHRLVASVYCQCPNIFCTEVDHIDGNPKNNRWDNLEWVTPQENVRRYYEKKKLLADSNN